MKKILIVGASGFIGTQLINFLLERGYSVSTLTRKKLVKENVESFVWDPSTNQIDIKSLNGVDVIINLAGENIGKGFWSKKRKSEILKSRTIPAKILFETIEKSGEKPKCYISSSGIAIYGIDSGPDLMYESSPSGLGFLSEVTQKWEGQAKAFEKIGVRTVALRTGIVLAKGGGVLPQMEFPIRFGLGSPLGSGMQGVSWIHMTDLCRLFEFVLENEQISGPYNAVSPEPVSNHTFMQTLAKTLQKPFFLPKIPSFILYLILGEKATLIVGGNFVSSQKLQKEGFHFSYPHVKDALNDIYSH